MKGLFYDGLTKETVERELTPEEIAEMFPTPAEQYDFDLMQAETNRRGAYQAESDPLFFQWQRGAGTEQAWLDAVQAIKDRYPYPEAQ